MLSILLKWKIGTYQTGNTIKLRNELPWKGKIYQPGVKPLDIRKEGLSPERAQYFADIFGDIPEKKYDKIEFKNTDIS